MQAAYDGVKLMLYFPEGDLDLGKQTLEFLIEVYEANGVDADPVRLILSKMDKKETIQ